MLIHVGYLVYKNIFKSYPLINSCNNNKLFFKKIYYYLLELEEKCFLKILFCCWNIADSKKNGR